MDRTNTSPNIMAINAKGLILAALLGVEFAALFGGIELGDDDTVVGLFSGINGEAIAPSDPGLVGSDTIPLQV